MGTIADQVHDQFKMFAGPSIAQLTAAAEKFVEERKLAPKSIGVEHLEGSNSFVLTLGYRNDEPGYPISFDLHELGRADNLDDLSAIEKAMGAAARRSKGIICHELYINAKHEFFLVTMQLA